MTKNYSDFDKLNRLLVACFEAEKLYFNAAEDAQNTELKRFLHFMAVERNRMANAISTELSSRGIEPLVLEAENGHQDRTWHEIKDALVHFDAEAIITECLNRDKLNIKRYDELIEAENLPEMTLGVLYKQKQQLQWYAKQAIQHRQNPEEKEAASTRKEALYGKSSVTPKQDEEVKVVAIKKRVN